MFASAPPASSTLRAILQTALNLAGWVDLGRLRALVLTGEPLARIQARCPNLPAAPVLLFVATPSPASEADLLAYGAFGEALRAAATDRGLATTMHEPSGPLDDVLRELGEIRPQESIAGSVAIGYPR